MLVFLQPCFRIGESAISCLKWQRTWKRTWFCMMQRRPTVATSAAIQALELINWKDTCWFTVERSLSRVHTVIIFSQETNTQTYSFVCTQCQHSCTIPENLKIHTRTHCTHTQCKYSYTTDGALKLHIQTHTGEKISVAFSATIPAPELAPLRLTCSPIQEISLLDVHSVTIPA